MTSCRVRDSGGAPATDAPSEDVGVAAAETDAEGMSDGDSERDGDTVAPKDRLAVSDALKDELAEAVAPRDRLAVADGKVEADGSRSCDDEAGADADALAPNDGEEEEIGGEGDSDVVDVAEPLAPRERVAVADGGGSGDGEADGARRMATLKLLMVALATPASLSSQEYLATSTPLVMMLDGTRDVTLT